MDSFLKTSPVGSSKENSVDMMFEDEYAEPSSKELNKNKKRVMCTECKKSYCDKGALKIHVGAVHRKEMHRCTVAGCTAEFSSRRSRNRHSMNRNPKLHSIGVSFRSPSNSTSFTPKPNTDDNEELSVKLDITDANYSVGEDQDMTSAVCKSEVGTPSPSVSISTTSSSQYPYKQRRKNPHPSRVVTPPAVLVVTDQTQDEPLDLSKTVCKTETDQFVTGDCEMHLSDYEMDSEDEPEGRVPTHTKDGKMKSEPPIVNPADIEWTTCKTASGCNQFVPINRANPRQCVTCGKSFQNHFSVKTHFQNVHLKLKHKCSIDGCIAEFPSKRSRDRHSGNLKMHNRNLVPSDLVTVIGGHSNEMSESLQPSEPTVPPTKPIAKPVPSQVQIPIATNASSLFANVNNPMASRFAPNHSAFVQELMTARALLLQQQANQPQFSAASPIIQANFMNLIPMVMAAAAQSNQQSQMFKHATNKNSTPKNPKANGQSTLRSH